jgi:alkanesulfonate monooxygenase SsuD/methylene tetrahydromethanopterin reductase-like flavin-dependent oxidoreductase (luciferase family)
VALGAIAADTDEEAAHLALSIQALGRRLRRGDLRPIPAPEEAKHELAEGGPSAFDEEGEWPRHLNGSASTVRQKLTALAEALKLDELMIVTIVHDHQARLKSYRLLADAFELKTR